MYQTSPTTGLAGTPACAYLRRPPAVILPVIATSPPNVAPAITAKLATLPKAPFSIVRPPTTARVPLLIMLPTLSTPDVALMPPALRYAPVAIKLPALVVKPYPTMLPVVRLPVDTAPVTFNVPPTVAF